MSFLHNKKEYNYFECFKVVTKIAKQEALYLEQVLADFHPDEILNHVTRMHEMENTADMKKHELCNHLAKDFITPIEREDISLLSQKLDNIVDSIEDVIQKIYMYHITEVRHEANEFAKLVSECCSSFDKLLVEFAQFKKSKTIHSYIIEINTIENQGDRLHADSIHRLFIENQEPSKLLAWNMVFEAFEDILDSCENAANIIEDIITKNT